MVMQIGVLVDLGMRTFGYLFSILAILVQPTCSFTWEASPCGLPHQVPSSKRINISVGMYSGPIGIVFGDWDSASAIAEVTRILLVEQLGYNTIMSAASSNGLTSVQMVANCKNPGSNDPQCENPSLTAVHHITLEVWDIYHRGLASVQELQGQLAPENHGSIGYDGIEGIYVLQRKMHEVYESTGLALSYYRSWNISWNNWSSYFAEHTDIHPSELESCERTRMNLASAWVDHVKYTNDTGGVEMVNGVTVGKCEGGLSGHWWFGPACRMDPTNCIPLLTAGGGWGIPALSQQLASYNMPVALATAHSTSVWRLWPRQQPMLLYWWQPDIAFVDLHPQLVIFPETDRTARSAGDYRTQGAAVPLMKFTHHSFGTNASRARDLIANMIMPMQKIEDIMRLQLAGASVTSAACQWLKNNVDTWETWIPNATTCKAGNGIVNENGDYVTDRYDAASCSMCVPGRASNETGDGLTYACISCPRGKHSGYMANVCSDCRVGRFASSAASSSCEQASIGSHVPLQGATQSIPCPKGTFVATTGNSECAGCSAGEFIDAIGSTECIRCPIGRYAMTPGHTACVNCSNPDTSTLGMGSRSDTECICKPDMYLLGAISSGNCQKCPAQMVCPQGTTERSLARLLLQGEPLPSPFGDFAEPYPVLMKGFWSSESNPFAIYRCWNEDKCPGGPPGSCAPDMDQTKLSCSHCRQDYYWNGRKCTACSGLDMSGWTFPGLGFVLAFVVIIVMYELFTDPMREWNSWLNKLSVIGFLVFNHYQILVLLGEANVELPEAISGSIGFWRFAESVIQIFNLECAGYGEFQHLVIAQSLTPIIFFLCIVVVICVYWIAFNACEIRRMAIDLNRMQNVFFTALFTYFIGIANMSMALFQCKENPNGDYSLSRDLNMICFESAWYDVLVVAIFAVLLYCISLGSLFAWVLLRIELQPSLLDDQDFQMRWKFLLNKFNPEIHWWPLAFLIRGVLLNLSFVVSTSGVWQIYFFLSVEIVYLLLSVWFMPWRFRMANLCSVFLDASIVYLSTVPLVYVDFDSGTEKGLAKFGAAVCFLPLLIALFLFAFIVVVEYTDLLKRTDPGEEFEKLCLTLGRCLEANDDERRRLIAGLGALDEWYFNRARLALEARFLAIYSRHTGNTAESLNSKMSRVHNECWSDGAQGTESHDSHSLNLLRNSVTRGTTLDAIGINHCGMNHCSISEVSTPSPDSQGLHELPEQPPEP